MAMNAASLKTEITALLTASGFDVTNEHAKVADLAEAIASAVTTHIAANAEVVIDSGSSAGTYQVV